MTTTTERSSIPAPSTNGATKPLDLPVRGWLAALGRTISRFRADNRMDNAAALTYYTVLSIFPALIALVSILGLAGQNPQTTNALLKIVDDLGPSSAVDTLRGPIEHVVNDKGSAGVLLFVGLAVAVWSASAYVGAYTRASNAIYKIEEGRPFWKLRPAQLLMTLALVLMLAIVGVAVVITGPVASAVAKPLGLGDAAVTAWNIAKWPVLLAVVLLILAVLFYWAPDKRQPAFRWITPGSVLAVAVWIVASAGFAFYVANFGSYNKTYGSLGGAIAFLVWLWISNVAVLLGTQLNAELDRERKLS